MLNVSGVRRGRVATPLIKIAFPIRVLHFRIRPQMSDRRRKLEQLRAKKSKGSNANDEDLYDEVSLDEYKRRAQERILEDDFVVDDNGEGYVDTGAYEWEDGHNYYSDEDDEGLRSLPSKKKHKKNAEEPRPPANDITKLIRNSAAIKQTKPKPVKVSIKIGIPSCMILTKTNDEDDKNFMDDILSGLGSKKKPRARNDDAPKQPSSLPAEPSSMSQANTMPSSPPVREEPSSPPTAPPMTDADFSDHDVEMEEQPSESANGTKRTTPESGQDESGDELSVKPIAASARPVERVNKSVNRANAAAPPKVRFEPLSRQQSPSAEPPKNAPNAPEMVPATLDVELANDTSEPTPQSIHLQDIKDEDGSFNLFWTDYYEGRDSLLLIGKVHDPKTNSYPSCMVQIKGTYRHLYVLPRENTSLEEVNDEIADLLHKHHGVDQMISQVVKKKYCFELEGIPREETEYLEVQLPCTIRDPLSSINSGATFSHIFGKRTGMLEQYVLDRRIKGPCWIRVNESTELANASWCKLGAVVEDPRETQVLVGNGPVALPPMTLMSLSVRTLLNNETHKQEVVAISYRIYRDVQHDSLTPIQKLPSSLHTEVRPIDKVFPPTFERTLKEQRAAGRFTLHKTESALLNGFLEQIQRYDPDVLIGHDLESVHLSIILHRMKALNINQWHKIGRLRLPSWPQTFTTGNREVMGLRNILTGRLLADVSNEMGKSLTTKCDSWTLQEMCDIYLENDFRRVDGEMNAGAYRDQLRDGRALYDFFVKNEYDALYAVALAFKVQLLALSKQLTNLAGNSWAHTLNGSRAERNEFILLHEFTQQGYIVPDKTYGREAGKKEKYSGGKVLEPEKGLHKHVVLVMDFNSLYPSLIQEFNICFTTVDRSNCKTSTDPLPDLPAPSQPLGILPRLIKTLVERRRDVKKLMKDPKAKSEEIAQWDIRQQALKLTANSMYGCLGFVNSRFYALPLAMLTTAKGREALTSATELAAKKQLHVIYGDTDSVMINTNVDDHKMAIQVGNEFKQLVNEQYRELEIDIDNIFQRMLLLQKKKYAATVITGSKDGKATTKLEVKGLDQRRREYCQISKQASQYVLEKLLYEPDVEVANEEIIKYLENLAEDMRENKKPLAGYIIRNQLGKSPDAYTPELQKSLAHVAVALRKQSRGDIVRPGDVMQYIVCKDTEDSSASAAERAFTMAEMKQMDKVPDAEYYLSNQVFNVIKRLLGPIEGAPDEYQIGQSLGLSVSKHKQHAVNEDFSYQGIQPFESTKSDEERFRQAARLEILCKNGHRFVFDGLQKGKTVSANGVECAECNQVVPMTRINAQLEAAIRREISNYYNAWLVCGDSSCNVRTRQVDVYGKRCHGPDQQGFCNGVMKYEYSDRQLYDQLLYFDSLFDVDRAKQRKGQNDDSDSYTMDEISVRAEQNRQRFEVARKVVTKYLNNSGRRYVDMHAIFSFV
uniref:DNA polymerase n=1 Tax=Blastobotrys adeninivorans TaxID=409370 RepID=A0A060TBJ3_BLAAD